jgi:hypothetical protein
MFLATSALTAAAPGLACGADDENHGGSSCLAQHDVTGAATADLRLDAAVCVLTAKV